MQEKYRAPIKKRMAEKMKTAAELAEKIAGLDLKIGRARDAEDFSGLPELKERRTHAAEKHAAIAGEVADLEVHLVRARDLDRTIALRAAAKAAGGRAVEASDDARAAVALAVQKTADAVAFSELAARYARGLGANPAGWNVPARAISSPGDPTLFAVAGVLRVQEVRWPIVAAGAAVPRLEEELLPPWAVGSLITPEEMARHRAIAAELDGGAGEKTAVAVEAGSR